MGFSASLTIEELTGGGTPGRVLVLTGPSMPFQGAAWKAQTKVVTKWPAGNPEAVQQVLGPRLIPSRWQGEWRRTMMGKSPAKYTDETGQRVTIVDPSQLMTVVELVQQAGYRLRVTYAQGPVSVDTPAGGSPTPDPTQGKIVREGRIDETSFQLDRLQDIAWEISFEWLSRGVSTQQVSPVRDDSLVARAAALTAEVNQLVANFTLRSWVQANAAIPRSAGTLTLGQLERMANVPLALMNQVGRTVQQNVDDLARVVGVARTVAVLPLAVANQAVNIALNTVDVCNSTVDSLTRTPPELSVLNGSASDLCRSAKFYADARTDFANVGNAAYEAAVAVARRRTEVGLQGKPGQRQVKMGPSDVLAVHVAKPGDTPARVSLRYYNSPDHGRDILQANRLPLYQVQLPVGRPIVIPVLAVVR